MLLAAPAAISQAAAPGMHGTVSAGRVADLVTRGTELLEREDPIGALEVFRSLRALDPEHTTGLVGLGQTHLLLGEPWIALRYAEAALAREPGNDRALGLQVRAYLRARRFSRALIASSRAVAKGHIGVDLLAAHASALFRMQRIDDAAAAYRRVLELDPDHAEAHLRLGSGLTPPRETVLPPSFHLGVRAARAGRYDDALEFFRAAHGADPGNPVIHRLIGETLANRRASRSMASLAPEFAELDRELPEPAVRTAVVEQFMPRFDGLHESRRRWAARSLELVGEYLPTLVQRNAEHDLMLEGERTTDAVSRANLRGKRTFDGRVWDDVRGIGGLRAATGIEALDETAQFGFDTLAHELAHQVHLHALGRATRARIRQLFDEAIEHDRCLDYYAASNFAEYFGQGLEAFSSHGKRPTYEATHGHTRFELMRVDPKLHDLIAQLVSVDPLGADAPAEQRERILRSAIAVALRCGRPADAVTAAEMLPDGPDKAELLATARRALVRARSL